MNLKTLERSLRVNLFGPGPRLMKKEFTGPRSHKFSETQVLDHFSCPMYPHTTRCNVLAEFQDIQESPQLLCDFAAINTHVTQQAAR